MIIWALPARGRAVASIFANGKGFPACIPNALNSKKEV